MSNEHKHDPVSALSEADATGITAEIFAEIREVMQIPLVTSIWRTLAAIENGLEKAWTATRPIYESGQADAILEKLKREVNFPMPGFPSQERLEAAEFKGEDRPIILATLDAYNRSNTLNLIALTTLVSDSKAERSNYSRAPSPAPWPTLPPLLSKEEINASDWEQVRVFIEAEASSISSFSSSKEKIPTEAFEMIRSYVGKPPSVSRMVTVGHGVVSWLRG